MRLRLAICTVAVACAQDVVPEPAPAPPSWVYEPRIPQWGFGEDRGRFGRSQPVQRPRHAGVTGAVRAPLHQPTPWPVPGAGPARAVVSGREGGRPAVELVDIDGGALVWRDTATCKGPVVGVTDTAIVCTDVAGTRGLGLDGKPRWQSDKQFLAMTGDRVVVADGAAVVLDARDGSQLARVQLPAPVQIETIVASCGAELFAFGKDGKLARIAGGKLVWSVVVGDLADLDPCTGDSVLVRSTDALTAIARATGKVTGRVDGVRGSWRARDDRDRVEVAGAAGVASYPRDLAGPATAHDLPPLGELLATRGDRRLVRATPQTAVLLDRAGVHSYFPLTAIGAVLGDTTIVAASGTGSAGEQLRRVGIPDRARRAVRVPGRRSGTALPAELRDLPAAAPLDTQQAIAKPDTGKHAVATFALDPYEPHVVYAVALERAPDDTTPSALAAVDLAKRTWRWQRGDGCGPGAAVAVALAADIVACASRGVTATVRATSRDGAASWEWETDNVDALAGAGDYLLVHDADRLAVLDARTGRPVARFTSDDGSPVRAALVALGDVTEAERRGPVEGRGDRRAPAAGAIATALPVPSLASAAAGWPGSGARWPSSATRSSPLAGEGAPAPEDLPPTYLLTAEGGRLVARLPDAGMLPVWSLRVGGVISSISPAGDGVLVALEDGDAYRIDVRTAAVTPIPGLGLAWRASGELVTGATVGGPIPGIPKPSPVVVRPRVPVVDRFGRPILAPPQVPGDRTTEPPPIWTPIPPPPSLGDSWQLVLYERSGGLRARNDYAIAAPVIQAPRGPTGSPLVVAYGPELREVIVLDPRTGDPLRRVTLPDRGFVFGTIVDGTPVAGAVLASPLRVVIF